MALAVAAVARASLQSRCLYVADLPRHVDKDKIISALLSAVPAAQRIEVAQFQSTGYNHPRGCKHKGFAYILVDDVADLEQATASLNALHIEEARVTVAPAHKLPRTWTPANLAPPLDSEEAVRKEALQTKSRQHNQRTRQRRVQDHVTHLQQLLSNFSAVGEQSYQQLLAADMEDAGPVDWASMPTMCDPGLVDFGKDEFRCCSPSSSSAPDTAPTPAQHSSAGSRRRRPPAPVAPKSRNLRKRAQVESFALIMMQIMTRRPPGSRRLRVVDFGSGTGNLVLPLAATFPDCSFHAVDMKERCVEILLERAAAAGLQNVTASACSIQEYEGEFDLALALHACGSATDYAMLQAIHNRAAYIVSPCCVGKIVAMNTAAELQEGDEESIQRPRSWVGSVCGLPLKHPRSAWMTSQLPPPATPSFQLLAQAADYSHSHNHSHPQEAVLAKTCIEMDRNAASAEAGYSTALLKLVQPELTTKSDVLVGIATERVGTDFQWPWQ